LPLAGGLSEGDPMKAKRPTTRIAMLAALLAVVSVGVSTTQTADARPAPSQGLYVPPPDHGAKSQIARLTSQGDKADAELIRSMINTPKRFGSHKARRFR